jgi:DNA-binding response OmpR family regulator
MKLKALLIDDEPEHIDLGKLYLERNGVEAEGYTSVQEALEEEGDYDAVIVDSELGRLSGAEAVDDIRERYGGLVIGHTAYTDPDQEFIDSVDTWYSKNYPESIENIAEEIKERTGKE